MLTKTQFETMFDLQEALNIEMKGNNWRVYLLPRRWCVPVFTESAELVESTPYKWWKDTTLNELNIQIELVDLWHFIMSYIMSFDVYDKKVRSKIIDRFINEKMYTIYNLPKKNLDDEDDIFSLVVDLLDLNVNMVVNTTKLGEYMKDTNQFIDNSIQIMLLFFRILQQYVDDINPLALLYKFYIGKNILNSLRKTKGYNKGVYKKIWKYNGLEVEDNYVMYLEAKKLDVNDNFDVKLKNILNDIYDNQV